MPNTNSTSTDQFNRTKFNPHGRVVYEDRGKVLWAKAIGPFNMELMSALREMAGATFPAMASRGPWAQITTFSISALCSPEVIAGLTDALDQMIQLGVAAEVTAFVMPSDVEGAQFMGPLYAKAFQDAGLRYEYFPSFNSAYRWAESVLGPLEV